MTGQCRECGATLDTTAAKRTCGSCAVRETAPVMPNEFWEAPELRKALSERHFGRVIRAYRRVFGGEVTQAGVGRWLGLTQGQVSRIERDPEPVRDLGKLERWARALNIPQSRLWFTFSDQSEDAYRSIPARSQPEPEVDHLDVEATYGLGRMFLGLDHWVGSSANRPALVDYLTATDDPLRRNGRSVYDTSVELFRAGAELYQLAGWRAYDSSHFEVGARHLRLALRLCRDAADEPRTAQVLASMSYHATTVGSLGGAMDLGRASARSAKRAGLRVLRAEAMAMQACELATRGDKRSCFAMLRESEPAIDGASGPNYALDGMVLTGAFAYSLRQLGQLEQAERYARRAVALSEGFDRGKANAMVLLASSLAGQGRIDEACAIGVRAVRMAACVHSALINSCLARLARLFSRFRDSAAVSELYRLMTSIGVPVPIRN
jgi:transcriptional regulator with XRE-family HTH domain